MWKNPALYRCSQKESIMGNKIVTEADRKFTPNLQCLTA
jgi:hypothetical protein